MLWALADVQTTLCAAPRRLRRIEGGKEETSTAGAVGTGSEGGEEPPPYVPNWQQVKTNSNLALAENKLEWLLNCVPPGVNEIYDTLGARLVIELGVQSALFVRRRVDRGMGGVRSQKLS